MQQINEALTKQPSQKLRILTQIIKSIFSKYRILKLYKLLNFNKLNYKIRMTNYTKNTLYKVILSVQKSGTKTLQILLILTEYNITIQRHGDDQYYTKVSMPLLAFWW